MKLILATIRPLLYGVQMTAAVSLALFVAFYLQLDTPSWAGTTAAIVCQPVVGSALLKGAFRLVGTAFGAVAAVLLTAVFPQDRFGFLFGMLVWAAACSFVSTLLRNFAAYAAMLAGYTLIIIAGTSIAAPDQVFEIAVNRASEICVGIVAGTLVVGLTDLGDAPKRLSNLLSRLIAETALHLAGVLAGGDREGMKGANVRRALIARTAALDPIIDQAAGESPELLQRRSVLRAAIDGLFEALSGARIVETHLRNLPEAEAARNAQIVCGKLPDDWRAPDHAQSALDRDGNLALVRNLVGLETEDLSLRLTADGAADVASGLAAAANGLALINDPARARAVARAPKLVVADYLPAMINALRVFLGVGAVVLLWIVTAWPNGPQALIFTAVTIMVFSPMQDRSIRAALGQGAGTLIAAVVVAFIKFVLLVNKETFGAFALMIAIGLVPLGALSSVPLLAPFFIPASLNFVPMLSPTNLMTFDVASYLNTALGLLTGCAAGGLALLLIPHLPLRIRSQRLVDLSIRDLRRLAAGKRNWTLREWQGRIYARMIEMPEAAEPVQRSFLVTTLSVGMQVIRLSHFARHGQISTRLTEMRQNLAPGDLATLRHVLDDLSDDLAAVPDTVPGARGRLRARSALLAIEDAVNRHSGYFESRP
jgi:uncharacterized membrane protein YccC